MPNYPEFALYSTPAGVQTLKCLMPIVTKEVSFAQSMSMITSFPPLNVIVELLVRSKTPMK